LKVQWSAARRANGYRLDGTQTFYYPNGGKQWQATFIDGRRTGTETCWSESGAKRRERTYAGYGSWTWRIFDGSLLRAESQWKGNVLIRTNVEPDADKE
jgi:hypothetical protein